MIFDESLPLVPPTARTESEYCRTSPKHWRHIKQSLAFSFSTRMIISFSRSLCANRNRFRRQHFRANYIRARCSKQPNIVSGNHGIRIPQINNEIDRLQLRRTPFGRKIFASDAKSRLNLSSACLAANAPSKRRLTKSERPRALVIALFSILAART